MLLFSCEKDKKIIIHGDNYKIWEKVSFDVLGKEYHYFDNKGKWTIFIVQNGCLKEYDGDDNLLDKRWDIIDDSTMIKNGIKARIIALTDTMFILDYIKRRDTFLVKPNIIVNQDIIGK